MAKAKTNLVIVESPAKAKTIGKYLGDGYYVTSSMGHLRDLPKSKLGVDIENDFEPQYIPIKGREDTIRELTDKAQSSAAVYLATDPDREGEAISWHLKELLSLPDDKAYRVTFNEITKKVVSESIKAPRQIDMDLVDAQQARRVLDRIVGYKLSPLLWTKIHKGLSAGRVQSVATRMVVDRENEIRAFLPEEYWNFDAVLQCSNGKGGFTARLTGNDNGKIELHSAEEAEKVKADVTNSPFIISGVKRADKARGPAGPFITSTLQQEASRKLNMTPKRTMSIAQKLYEGIDIGGNGAVGLITYMRTDSLRISAEAQAAAKELILTTYGEEFYPKTPRVFKSRAGAQDAHEAIRPSDVTLTPEAIKEFLAPEQYKLYKLIWSRFLASQMASAVVDTLTIDVKSAGYNFRATHSSMRFAGFTVLYDDGRDDETKDKKTLPELSEGEQVSLQEILTEQKFTQPPSRYTEDTLIRAMEEKGIGRPSTYAPTMSTILDREYVIKEGKSLKPTPLGEAVTDLLVKNFNDIVDMKFTANMELSLDQVEEGKKAWKGVIRDFYEGFEESLENAEENLKGVKIKIPAEETEELCDLCGRKMVIKSGKFGKFLACPGFPDCKFTKPLVVEMPGKCPKCGSRILKRQSKKGYTYYACEKLGKGCDFLTWDVPTAQDCPECEFTMFKRSGKGFNKPFCINPDCKAFLPEDKRGYKKKNTADSDNSPNKKDKTTDAGASETADAATAVKKESKKPAAKKTTGKGKTTAKTKAKKSASAQKKSKDTKIASESKKAKKAEGK